MVKQVLLRIKNVATLKNRCHKLHHYLPITAPFLCLQGGHCGKVRKMYVICLPVEHQGVHKNSFRNVSSFQGSSWDLASIFIVTLQSADNSR